MNLNSDKDLRPRTKAETKAYFSLLRWFSSQAKRQSCVNTSGIMHIVFGFYSMTKGGGWLIYAKNIYIHREGRKTKKLFLK